MIEFLHIKYGVLVAMMAILFGGSLGLSFGCCEDNIKDALKGNAEKVLSGVYGGDQAKADQVVKKSWIYVKRAHLHSQTMGVISIAFSLLVAWLSFPARAQMGISLLSGLGSLGYGGLLDVGWVPGSGNGVNRCGERIYSPDRPGIGSRFFYSRSLAFRPPRL